MLSESPRCKDMVADLHFPQFFGTLIQCEILVAWRFPRCVVKVGLNVKKYKKYKYFKWGSTLNLDGLKLSYFNP